MPQTFLSHKGGKQCRLRNWYNRVGRLHTFCLVAPSSPVGTAQSLCTRLRYMQFGASPSLSRSQKRLPDRQFYHLRAWNNHNQRDSPASNRLDREDSRSLRIRIDTFRDYRLGRMTPRLLPESSHAGICRMRRSYRTRQTCQAHTHDISLVRFH